jgi:hypothetical protein
VRTRSGLGHERSSNRTTSRVSCIVGSRAASAQCAPVRDHERVVDDIKCIRATIERFEGGHWKSRITCCSGGEAPLGPRCGNSRHHSTEIYWSARSAAAVTMYFK